MSTDKFAFGNKISNFLVKCLMNLIVPLKNRRRIPWQWVSLGGISSFKSDRNVALIECENGYLEIKLISPTIWRVRASKHPFTREHKSWASIEPPASSNIKLKQERGYLTVKTDKNISDRNDIIIRINERDSTVTFQKFNNEILNDESKAISFGKYVSWSSLQKISHEQDIHIGFGERTGKLAKNGRKMTFWNTDPTSYGKNDDPLYQSEPIQISIKKDGSAYGIFYDNHHYSIIKPKNDKKSTINYFTESDPICYYFFTGPTLKEVCKQISTINGTLPLPPKWILGHHQCRWSYCPEEKVREIARNFRERNIPCDSVHLDIDYMDGFRCFTWDKDRFPDPKKMISDLGEDGFKIIVITDPGLKVDQEYKVFADCIKNDYQCKLPNQKSYVTRVWPGKSIFPDFTNPDVREWWGTQFKTLFDVGVEGFWIDMNEPSTFTFKRTALDDVEHNMDGRGGDHQDAHNIFGQSMMIATREGVDKLRGNKRTFLFTRSCYAGIQRYSASWTGDNNSNWVGLQQTIPMLLNMGLVGQPLVAVDIGGFSLNCTAELLTRWYQLGIFYPFVRNHSAKGTTPQEPWAFGEETEKIIKKYIELRYQLIPYLYTLTWEAILTGIPLMRPLFMEFPSDIETYNEKWQNSEFLVGDKLLVAPILVKAVKGKNSVNRDIYLPKGNWYDYWTKELLVGGKIIQRDVDIDQVPLFVKAGSILPFGPIVQSVEKAIDYPLFIEIFPDEVMIGNVYLDDGSTKAFEQGEYSFLTFQGIDKRKSISLDVSKKGNFRGLPSTNNSIHIGIYDNRIPNTVLVNDKKLKSNDNSLENYWEVNTKEGILLIVIKNPEFPMNIEITY
jgi:alpha-glucosidase